MTDLDEVARTILERRYLRQDETGAVVETPDEMFHRVASNLAEAEAAFGGDPEAAATAFYDAMSNLRFLPNSPTLMNAGTDLQQLAACFVLPWRTRSNPSSGRWRRRRSSTRAAAARDFLSLRSGPAATW
ncbi:ribonucleotide reductase N-terminal alpha domain-containing protein [Haloplanus sp. GCM10025708]|uniref:ribonucleotide reductase N-terminal alpha domain-containing protein n=1 Tax=Haloplanus sp. GCM10025708 TaxID=3252679 RepID=UPI0036233173